MSRSKKTRKIGPIGVRKDPDRKPGQSKKSGPARPPKGKDHAGNPAGSRNSVDKKAPTQRKTKESTDPRVGSKKPVPLIKSTPKPSEKRRYTTPAQELAALETDDRLARLLDKLDNDEKLNRMEQAYVDEKMARHRVLCDILGIDEGDDDEKKDDPLSDLDAISIDDYKD